MGWWKTTIFGGDTPLDFKEKFYKICGVQEYGIDHKSVEIPKKKIKKNFDKILSLIEKEEDDDKNIAYQVFGAILIRSGYNIQENDGVMEKIIEASENDEYSKEDQVRRNVMLNFINTLKEYAPENPIDIEEYNMEKEPENQEDEIQKEFKQLFGIMNARIKKLKKGIEEKSGVKEYDEGYSDASGEEIDFLIDFKELMEKQEMLAIILDKINSGISETFDVSKTLDVSKPYKFDGGLMTTSPSSANSVSEKAPSNDVMPG